MDSCLSSRIGACYIDDKDFVEPLPSSKVATWRMVVLLQSKIDIFLLPSFSIVDPENVPNKPQEALEGDQV